MGRGVGDADGLLRRAYACAEYVGVRHGSRGAKKIAITVGDCYNAGRVRQIFEL